MATLQEASGRNAIGTHAGAYSLYRALAVAAGQSNTSQTFSTMTLSASSTLDFSDGAGATNTGVNLIFGSMSAGTVFALAAGAVTIFWAHRNRFDGTGAEHLTVLFYDVADHLDVSGNLARQLDDGERFLACHDAGSNNSRTLVPFATALPGDGTCRAFPGPRPRHF